ncbi:WlaTC/HtrL family glycosyltransferase, partial [Escherichia coli]
MKSSTTIITAYFDIGRGDWTCLLYTSDAADEL